MNIMHQPQSHQNYHFNQLNTEVAGGESTLVMIPTISSNVNPLDFMYDIDEECDLYQLRELGNHKTIKSWKEILVTLTKRRRQRRLIWKIELERNICEERLKLMICLWGKMWKHSISSNNKSLLDLTSLGHNFFNVLHHYERSGMSINYTKNHKDVTLCGNCASERSKGYLTNYLDRYERSFN